MPRTLCPPTRWKARKQVVPKLQYEDIEKVVVEFLRMARDRGLVVTGAMLRTLALEEAKKKGIADSRLLRGGSAGWSSATTSSEKLCAEKQQQSTPSSWPTGRRCASRRLSRTTRSPMYSTAMKRDRSSYSLPTALWLCLETMPTASSRTKTPHPPANGFLVGREGETSDDLEEWEPACSEGADKSKLPVAYRSQGKAWVTIQLFKEWIKEFDSHKNSQGRKVLLLMDTWIVYTPAVRYCNQATRISTPPLQSTWH